ncbi:MAG: phage holin family protein [Gemmatimonadota bacterium]
MRSLILRLLINAAALWAAARLVDGVSLTGDGFGILVVAVIFGLVNAMIKPVVKLLSLPLIFLSLGLFTLVINGLMLWLTSALSSVLQVDGLGPAIAGALVISIVSVILSWMVADGDRKSR